ncbi:MAG: DUF4271 domain-containing protein [Bacteroidaceae bacterium]|nr:DUF4271 domain-containing protein [Bacteroidaceae bacterium]MBR3907503.1 DUF4271 domain-containing protein [Bacteroidaceae bacterium]
MTGTPAPYSMTTDNTVMLLFIMNIIGISYVILMNGTSIVERLKGIVYYHHKSEPFNDRTHITRICNALMYAQTILYLTIISLAELRSITHLAMENAPVTYLSVFAGAFILFFILKRVAYDIVNSILYSKKEMLEWRNLYFFTIKLLGFALAPAVIAILFIPALPLNYVNFYIFLTGVIYICTITGSLIKIIFPKKRNYLEIFLYLCALEFLPMAMVWKSLLQLSGLITIKI